jgi:hypothetical protein
MNNYIILENRAELTTAQVLSGMNFSAVVAGAAAASADIFGGRSFGTGFMSKGFLAVLIVVGGAAVYKNYLKTNDESSLYNTSLSENENVLIRNKSKGPVLVMETIPPKNNKATNVTPSAACQPGNHDPGDGINNHLTYSGPYVPLLNADSLLAIEEQKAVKALTKNPTPNQMVQMPQPLTCGKVSPPINSLTTSPPFNVNGMTEEPRVFNTAIPFKASLNATSYLWNPASFNHNVESASGNFKLDCNGCDFSYISGAELDGKNYKGVWLRVSKDKKLKFKLETGLKNISLIRTEGNKYYTIHPVAVGVDGPQWRQKEWTYISNKFKTGGAIYTFGDHIDFYLIFEDARAGDKLIIDDFVETVVVEK